MFVSACRRLIVVVGCVCALNAFAAAAERRAHPIIAGFERLAHDPNSRPGDGGLLLVGELGCVSCHQADDKLARHLDRKQAPILDGVGARVRPSYLRAFLNDPRGVKPGTTMPDPFAGWPAPEKARAVEALTHWLASTGGLSHARPNIKRVAAGSQLYRRVGCVACHGPRGDREPTVDSTSTTAVPLGTLSAKYTIPSLAAFLADPLKVRPSGRMPGLNLTPDEARDLAEFLLRDLRGASRPNLAYRYYEGGWEKLPDFARLTSVATGKSEGFDLEVANRKDNMALIFHGTLKLPKEGRYIFHLRSDDGSKLYVDGDLIVDNDGIHPPEEKSANPKLLPGDHKLTVEVFNGGGGVELTVEMSGPGIRRQPIEGFLNDLDPAPAPTVKNDDERLTIDPALAAEGRALFARVGCASCHQFKDDERLIASPLKAPPLSTLAGKAGCLAESPAKGWFDYSLDPRQRAAITAALAAPLTGAPRPEQIVDRTLNAFNCYACHARSGRGGVESSFNSFFETTQREMGDEGRLPPLLDGVGAKLNADYLAHTLADGLKDRPYMLTRMPRFGASNTAALAKAFEASDHVDPVSVSTLEVTPHKVKSTGRFLVGGEALGCVKCHTFKGSEAEGVQAIDMTVMTKRLRRDWFHRYVVNPPLFRPGTRMPTAWPDGKSMLPKVLGGDTLAQVEAIWRYLADGTAAAEPYGLGREPMPLFALTEPVIYRNFIEGAGPRAIGVGYPERANLAFDANDLRLALIWQNGFIDASRHWGGRGVGFQPPMGDNVVSLPAGVAFASLSTPDQPWPDQSAKALDYAFRGYRLDPGGKPTFLYDLNGTRVEDHANGVAATKTKAAGLSRTFSFQSQTPPSTLWFRAAVGDTIQALGDHRFLVNGEWTVRLETRAEPVMRTRNGKTELIVPIRFDGKTASLVEQFEW